MQQEETARVFSALGNDVRLKVFLALAAEGDGGLQPAEIIRRFGVQPATLSFHLKVLADANLLSRYRRDGLIHYKLKSTRLLHLMETFASDLHKEASAASEYQAGERR